jgi:hypothetical protein
MRNAGEQCQWVENRHYNSEVCPVESATTASDGLRTEKSTTAGRPCDRPLSRYTAVLVRLSGVTPDVLRDLLGMAHKFVTSHEERRSPSRNHRKPV